jgi:hypothetical protein
MAVDPKEYAMGFVSAFIGVAVAIAVTPTLMGLVGNLTGVPLLSSAIVGIVVGAGVLFFMMKAFF